MGVSSAPCDHLGREVIHRHCIFITLYGRSLQIPGTTAAFSLIAVSTGTLCWRSESVQGSLLTPQHTSGTSGTWILGELGQSTRRSFHSRQLRTQKPRRVKAKQVPAPALRPEAVHRQLDCWPPGECLACAQQPVCAWRDDYGNGKAAPTGSASPISSSNGPAKGEGRWPAVREFKNEHTVPLHPMELRVQWSSGTSVLMATLVAQRVTPAIVDQRGLPPPRILPWGTVTRRFSPEGGQRCPPFPVSWN